MKNIDKKFLDGITAKVDEPISASMKKVYKMMHRLNQASVGRSVNMSKVWCIVGVKTNGEIFYLYKTPNLTDSYEFRYLLDNKYTNVAFFSEDEAARIIEIVKVRFDRLMHNIDQNEDLRDDIFVFDYLFIFNPHDMIVGDTSSSTICYHQIS